MLRTRYHHGRPMEDFSQTWCSKTFRESRTTTWHRRTTPIRLRWSIRSDRPQNYQAAVIDDGLSFLVYCDNTLFIDIYDLDSLFFLLRFSPLAHVLNSETQQGGLGVRKAHLFGRSFPSQALPERSGGQANTDNGNDMTVKGASAHYVAKSASLPIPGSRGIGVNLEHEPCRSLLG